MAALAPPRLPREAVERGFASAASIRSTKEARAEANRCLHCQDAPCARACPTRVDIPGFLLKIASGDLRGAGSLVIDASPLGATCAAECDSPSLCERECRQALQEQPVAIARLERFAVERLLAAGSAAFALEPRTGRRVAVVGGGPAGLTGAIVLARLGDEVVLLAAAPPRHPEARFLPALGITLRLAGGNRGDVSGAALLEEFDAVFLALEADAAAGPEADGGSGGSEPPADGARGKRVRLRAPGAPLAAWLDALGVRTQHGRIAVDPGSGRTTNPRVFAAGPHASGRTTAVHAVRDARIAAAALHLTVSAGSRAHPC